MGLHTGGTNPSRSELRGERGEPSRSAMALAHGGQILVSDTTEVLLRGHVTLRPLGEHVFAVCAGGSPVPGGGRRAAGRIPVLRTVDDFVDNLPRQLSRWSAERRWSPTSPSCVRTNRLVTLTGLEASARTPLALEVGAELAGASSRRRLDRRPRRRRCPAALRPRSRRCWGSHRRVTCRSSTRSPRRFAGRPMLVVVDNCEHVLAAAASAMDAILGRSGSLRIVATSTARRSGRRQRRS